MQQYFSDNGYKNKIINIKEERKHYEEICM